MADYGTDISTFLNGDLDPSFTVISGPQVVVEAVARRLTTPQGSLISDPAYGFDVRQLLHADLDRRTESRVVGLIRSQVEADERILSSSASLTRTGETLAITVRFRTQDGPFAFTLSVGAARVALLAAGASA
jgi:phage baseplate assembly protein W